MKARNNLLLTLLLAAICCTHFYTSCADQTIKPLNHQNRKRLDREYGRLAKSEQNEENVAKMLVITTQLKTSFELLQRQNPLDQYVADRNEQIKTWSNRQEKAQKLLVNLQTQALCSQGEKLVQEYKTIEKKLANTELTHEMRKQLLEDRYKALHNANIVYKKIIEIDPTNKEVASVNQNLMMQSQIHHQYSALITPAIANPAEPATQTSAAQTVPALTEVVVDKDEVAAAPISPVQATESQPKGFFAFITSFFK